MYSFSPPKSFEIKLYSGKSPVAVIGYIFVLPTPWFGKTDVNGAASIRDAAFTLDAVPRKAKYKPPMDRLKY